MKINGDIELSGDLRAGENLEVTGDVSGVGTLAAYNILKIGGDVDSAAVLEASTVEVSGDLTGRTKVRATTLVVKGDVDEQVDICADIVVIHGDRAHSVKINCDNVTVYGDDETAEPADHKDDNVITGVFGGVTKMKARSGTNSLNVVAGGTSYQVKSDGGIQVNRNRVCTRGANVTQFEISRNGVDVTVFIQGGDIDEFGIVVGGDVFVDGQHVKPNVNGVTDIKDSGSKLLKEIYVTNKGWHPTARF